MKQEEGVFGNFKAKFVDYSPAENNTCIITNNKYGQPCKNYINQLTGLVKLLNKE